MIGRIGRLARDRAGEIRVVQSRRFRISFRSALLGSLALGALLTAAPVQAADAQQLNLPAGSLEAALTALAAQTGDQLVYTPDLVNGRRVPALTGRYDVDAALAQLLTSSNIVATRAGPRLIVLKRRQAAVVSSAAPAAEVPTQTARPFVREASADPTSDTPVVRQLDRSSETAPPAPTVAAVEVTGSHIRGVGAGASPLVVISRDDLDRSGHATLAEALSILPQNFGGLNTEGTVATGADAQGLNSTYATSVNLRGLGSDATLVLVNGRRLAGSGADGNFTDVSALPAIAISRVEILMDGASAIYGSDAVGGVVNVILRRDLEGGEVRVSAGTGTNDTPRQYQLGAVFGHTWSTGGFLVAYEGDQRNALAAADRPYTDSADLRPFGGSDFRITTAFPGNVVAINPATHVSGPFYGIPAGQNGLGLTPSSFEPGVVNEISRQQGLDVLPGQGVESLYGAFHQDLGDRVELSGDARYGFRAARTAIAGSVATLTIGRNDPFFVSPNGAASNQIQYSFIGELPNPIIRATAESFTSSFGAHVRLPGDWGADGYLGFAQEIDSAKSHGVVNTEILSEALGNVPDNPATAYNPSRDGFFNPYTGIAANPASVTDALGSGFTSSRSRSQVDSANLQADGTLFTLPGGAVKLAIGANIRRETFDRNGSSFTSTAVPTPQGATSGERTVEAVFAETRVPLVSADNARPGVAGLELSLAVRAEHYSDFGNTVDPKFGLIWSPISDLRVRATYGTSFRAPSLEELLSADFISPINFPSAGGTLPALAEQGGNPNLRPETATSWTAGVEYDPHWLAGSHFSLTWFDTDFRGRIDRPVSSDIAGALTDPRFVDFVQHVSPATNPTDLALVEALLANPTATAAAGLTPATSYVAILDLRSVNTGELQVRGLDLEARQAVDLYGGHLALSLAATRLLTYAEALTPTAPSFELVGLATNPAKLRGRLSADWSRDLVGANVALNYVSDFHDTLGVRIADQATVDLQLRAKAPPGRFEGTTFSVSVRNLFNQAPPFYNNPFGYAYDPANADVIGRFVQLQLTRSW
jgi:iron complex outermembrane recepter protein